MTGNDESVFARIGDSRRSFLKKGALASTAALGATGVTAAQDAGQDGDGFDDDELFVEEEASNAFVFRDAWNPVRPFVIASGVLRFTPDVPDVRDELWDSYNTRAIRYLGTNDQVLFFPNDDATIGPFEEELGYVVDDDFVENDTVVLDGTPIDELDENEVRQIRPTIWAMEPNTQVFEDENLIRVRFSPIPEDQEDPLWNRFEDDFFD